MVEGRVEAGAVRSVECLRRRIRVRPLPGLERLFDDAVWVWVVMPAPTAEKTCELRCKVGEVRVDMDERILTLAPGVTRDDVARMKGAAVFLESHELTEGEYGLVDLEGLQVLDAQGTRLGVVTSIYPTMAGGAFEVERDDGGTFVLPAIDQVIESVDVEGGIVVVGDIAPYAVEDED